MYGIPKKEIRISYRYVLVNDTDSLLMVRQADSSQETELLADTREGLVWSSSDNKNIQVSMPDYQYSCQMNTNNLGRLGIQLSPLKSRQHTPQVITVDI